jgi:predicted 2-oxoglutarate/Fe(II)-dependent dioxygenase YbiX
MDTGKDNFKIVDVKLKVGQMVQFPLVLLHRLTPIIKGVRKQLLTWYTGEFLNW